MVVQQMGQRLARLDINDGVRLYHEQRHNEAIDKWQAALRRLRSRQERFITLGYLAQAQCEAGRYRDMLVFSLQQIDIANEVEDGFMRAEAYLNLARCNERLAEFHKAISYSRHSLQDRSSDPRTPGYAYLCMGCSYLGFSDFARSLENFELAMQIANQTQDRLLELQICVGLGSLFTQLKDNCKALLFLANANELLESISIANVRTKYRSLVDYHLSITLRQKCRYDEAQEKCEEAMNLTVTNGNRPIQARCLLALGDIFRDLNDAERCWSSYEQALDMFAESQDRVGQVLTLGSMAKASFVLKSRRISQCECQAIDLNKRCLEIAKAIGFKLAILKCHARLVQVYTALKDDANCEVQQQQVDKLVKDMETFCNFCCQTYGIKEASLQALPCSHLFHERCLKNFVTNRQTRICPKCWKCTPSTSTDV